MVSSIGEADVVEYQNTRLKARAANKSINEEVGFLLRILGESGDSLRLRLKRARKLKLAVRERVGRALTLAERDALLEVARKRRSPHIVPAILLSIDAGLRDSEIKGLQWGRIDFDRRVVTVGKSKTQAGEGRTVPMSEGVYAALTDHARWFTDRFGVMLPEHYCFPFGRPQPTDPTRPVQTFKTAWKMVKEDAGVKARFHDGRHTFVTELAEAGASDEVIRSTVGHVSSQMIRHYSHIRTEAKRRGIAAIEELRQVRREQEKARLTAVELEVSSTLSTTLN
jgi:integrase